MIKTFDQALAALANPSTTNGDRWIAARFILERMIAEYPAFETLINEEYFLTDDWHWDGTEKITGIAHAIRQDFERQTRVKTSILLLANREGATWIEITSAAGTLQRAIEFELNVEVPQGWLIAQVYDGSETLAGLAEDYERDHHKGYVVQGLPEQEAEGYQGRLETMLEQTSRELHAAKLMIKDRIDGADQLWPGYLEDADYLAENDQ